MAGMDFNVILGFFGDQTVFPPSASLSIGAFGTSLDAATISFAQPKITLNVINDYGVPCKVDFTTLEARKAGATPVPFVLNPANPITVAFPSTLGTSATTPVSVTNAKQVLDFAPSEIYYQLNARVNQGLASGNNFLADTSKMRVNLDVEVPLFGYASGIELRDTAKIDLSNLTESEIQSASLKVDVTNDMPLDARIQLYLADDKYVIIDSLFETSQTQLIKGSTVTASGDLQTPGVLKDVLILNVDKLNKLFLSKNLIIRAVLNTSKDASGNSQDVKFKSKYTMIVNMGLLADLNFNITH
jgi:hypothetical protein